MRKLLVTAAALSALVFTGCGSQGAPSAEHHGGPSAQSTSPGSVRVVSQVRTCELLFYGHSPLVSRSLRMAMGAQHGREVDAGRVEKTASELDGVAERTRRSWRPAIHTLAEKLPSVTGGHSTKEDYAEFRAAHRTVVSHCTPYVD